VKLLGDVDLKDRRFAGLRMFLRRHPKTRRALVVSRTVTASLTVGSVSVEVVPLWEFLLRADLYL
jgi:hypothetical protein